MNGNFRRYALSLSLLVGVAVPWAATSQANAGSDAMENRIAQLERISSAQADLLTQFQQQLSDSQRDIDTLRGQIQENQYRLGQAVEQQKQNYQQPERVNQQGVQHLSTSVAEPADTTTSVNATIDAKTNAGDENSDYSTAVSLFIDKKQYDKSIIAFQNFIKNYPKSTYQPNANYWLGQLFYNKNNKDDAAYHYAVVVKNYPKSPKSSDSMLKVGIIMQDQGQTDKARAVYQQVITLYPDTDAAEKAKKRLNGLSR